MLHRYDSRETLAEALATSLSWLVGLDPDVEPPPELLAEDQGSLGLLAGDEEALLRAYRRLDLPTRAAVVLIARKLAGPEEDTPRQVGKIGRASCRERVSSVV